MSTNAQINTSLSTELLQNAAESTPDCEKPRDDDDGDPPPHDPITSEEYLLTSRAILTIVKSWDVGIYNPLQTNCTAWLDDIHSFCEQYGVPITQRASCAMHHMNTDYQEAALDAGCYNMTWDELTVWLRARS